MCAQDVRELKHRLSQIFRKTETPSLLDKVCMVATTVPELNARRLHVFAVEIVDGDVEPVIHTAVPTPAQRDGMHVFVSSTPQAIDCWFVKNGCRIAWSVDRSQQP